MYELNALTLNENIDHVNNFKIGKYYSLTCLNL